MPSSLPDLLDLDPPSSRRLYAGRSFLGDEGLEAVEGTVTRRTAVFHEKPEVDASLAITDGSAQVVFYFDDNYPERRAESLARLRALRESIVRFADAAERALRSTKG